MSKRRLNLENLGYIMADIKLKLSPYLERRYRMYRDLQKRYKPKTLDKYLRPGEKELFKKYRSLNAKGGLIKKPKLAKRGF